MLDRTPRSRWPRVVRWLGLLALGLAAYAAGGWLHEPARQAWSGVAGAVAEDAATLGRPRVWPEEVPTLLISIRNRNLVKLRDKRRDALREGVLVSEEDDLVPAHLVFDGAVHEARIRLKGDWVDHLGREKWSYRIRLRGDGRFGGMRVFNIQHPSTRRWDLEWAYHRALRRAGVLAPRYSFARVLINGADQGLYAVEEHFSRELLESQQRREGPIVRFDERGLWRQYALVGEANAGNRLPFADPRNHRVARVDAFGDARLSSSPALAAQRDAGLRLLGRFADGQARASEVFKVRELAAFLALAELWGAGHNLSWINARFYYDPVAARLEPIGFDANPLRTPVRGTQVTETEWVRQALRDPVVAGRYVAALGDVVQTRSIAEMREAMRPDWEQVIAWLRVEWPTFGSRLDEGLETRGQLIRDALASDPVVALRGRAGAHVLVRGPLPVELSSQGILLGAPPRAPLVPVILDNPGDTLGYGVPGLGRRTVTVRRVSPDLPTESSRPAFLVRDRGTQRITPGTHDVATDLVIPTGMPLEAGAGVTLRFAPGARLIVRGTAQLTGVRIVGGGGIVVVGGKVRLRDVDVQGARIGLLLIDSDATLESCRFRGCPVAAVRASLSRVRAAEINVDSSGIGIASCDLSHVEVDGLSVRDARIGAAAYDRVAPGTILVRRLSTESVTSTLLIQAGSRGFRDGLPYATRQIRLERIEPPVD